MVSDVFFDDDRKNTPPFATSFALNMMLTSDHGSAHAKTEMQRWMGANGFRDIAVHDMPQAEPAHADHRHQAVTSRRTCATERPPLWLVVATALMALVLLAMSVGETSLKGQYLIDQGEYLSLVGLGLHPGGGPLPASAAAGWSRRCRWCFPWLLYPVITQGDQIIDNLSINWMRIDRPRAARGDLRDAGRRRRLRGAMADETVAAGVAPSRRSRSWRSRSSWRRCFSAG